MITQREKIILNLSLILLALLANTTFFLIMITLLLVVLIIGYFADLQKTNRLIHQKNIEEKNNLRVREKVSKM